MGMFKDEWNHLQKRTPLDLWIAAMGKYRAGQQKVYRAVHFKCNMAVLAIAASQVGLVPPFFHRIFRGYLSRQPN